MVNCAVLTCKNSSHRKKNNFNGKFRKVPDSDREKWLAVIGREPDHCGRVHVCEEHFPLEQRHSPLCLEDNLTDKTTICDCKISRDAFPTLNLPSCKVVEGWDILSREPPSKTTKTNKKRKLDCVPNIVYKIKRTKNIKNIQDKKKGEKRRMEHVDIFQTPSSPLDVVSSEDEVLSMFDDEEDGIELSQLCRACALPVEEGGVAVYGTQGLSMGLEGLVSRYLPIQVTELDTLPLQLCQHCLGSLRQTDSLVSTCLLAQQTLRAIEISQLARQRALTQESAAAAAAAAVTINPDPSEMCESSPPSPPSPPVATPPPPPTPHKFSCESCSLGFDSGTDAALHCAEVHKKLTCPVCFSTFPTLTLLQAHSSKGHLLTRTLRTLHLAKPFNKHKDSTTSPHQSTQNSVTSQNSTFPTPQNSQNFTSNVPSKDSTFPTPQNLQNSTISTPQNSQNFTSTVPSQNSTLPTPQNSENFTSNPSIHVCNTCWKVFHCINTFKNHITVACIKNAPEKFNQQTCASCKRQFDTLDAFIEHVTVDCIKKLDLVQEHKPTLPQGSTAINENRKAAMEVLKKCTSKSFTMSNIARMIQSGLPEYFTKNSLQYRQNISCNECSNSFDISQILLHYSQEHGLKICVLCLNFTSTTLERVILHLSKSHHNNMKYLRNFYVKILQKRTRKLKKKCFMCEMCQEKFITKSEMRKHFVNLHFDGEIGVKKIFKCKICDLKFDSSGQLKFHNLSCHPRLNLGKFVQKYPYKLTPSSKLKISVVTKQKSSKIKVPYVKNLEMVNIENENLSRNVCTYCDLEFESTEFLNEHMDAHLI